MCFELREWGVRGFLSPFQGFDILRVINPGLRSFLSCPGLCSLGLSGLGNVNRQGAKSAKVSVF